MSRSSKVDVEEEQWFSASSGQQQQQDQWFSAEEDIQSLKTRRKATSSPRVQRKINNEKKLVAVVAKKKNKPSPSTILATASKKYIPRKMKHEVTTIRTKTNTPDVIKQVWDQLQISTYFPDFPYKLFLHLRSTPHKKTLGAYHDISKEKLEFLGDRVLKIIYGRIAFEMTDSAHHATGLVSILESNRVFGCYLEKMGKICSLLDLSVQSKKCGDFFEIIVGALFYFYFYKNADYNIIDRIDKWIRDVTIFSEHINHLLKMKDLRTQSDILCK